MVKNLILVHFQCYPNQRGHASRPRGACCIFKPNYGWLFISNAPKPRSWYWFMFCKEMRALDLKIQLPTPGFVEACHAGGRPPPPLTSARSCYRLDIKDQLGHWVQPCVWYCYFNKHNSTERSIGFLNPLQRPFFSLVFLSFRIENEVILKFLLNPERMAIQFVTHSLIKKVFIFEKIPILLWLGLSNVQHWLNVTDFF